MSESHWASFHLFRADPLDQFLTTAITPFVAKIATEGLVSGFFFVRYWEGGAHIRLRLRTKSMRPLVQCTRSYFEQYFKAHPSVRRFEPLSSGMFANDSVQEIEYQPEVSRYGGPKCIAISERQFEASSRAILSVIAERQWSYESAIGTAIQLHIIFASAMGFDVHEAAKFFAEASNQFLVTNDCLPAGLTVKRAVELFAESFAAQRDRLVGLQREVWSAMETGQQFEQEWANRWALGNIDTAKRLRRARALKARERWTKAEQDIMKSYVHMTNNRLGVLNRDEAYVGYVLMRGFQEMQ
jgi:thiopeptide-type bacteriocin biosynthesis protein